MVYVRIAKKRIVMKSDGRSKEWLSASYFMPNGYFPPGRVHLLHFILNSIPIGCLSANLITLSHLEWEK